MTDIPKIRKRLESVLDSDKSQTDIFLHGFIGEEYGGISLHEVSTLLAKVTTNIINLHINCGGGDAFESAAIYNLLKQHKATVNIYVDGIAASGGSEIAMAGDKIFMPKNTMMMIHNAWTCTAGNSKKLREIADRLDKLSATMTESYAARFVGSRDELLCLLDKETWLTAYECKSLGFCDEVLELDSNSKEVTKNAIGVNRILAKYIPNFNASTERDTLIESAREQQKVFNASLMYSLLENLSVKENLDV